MIVASHRGPERFQREADGTFTRQRGAGGVVSALQPLLAGGGAAWIAAAMGDGDRAAVAAGAARSDDFDLHLLSLDPDAHRLHYDLISNSLLWFLHHGLFDLPRRPVFDDRFEEAWSAFRSVNQAFADEIVSAARDGDPVLVQDYHLALVPAMVRAQRPDVSLVYFQHTPHCGPNSMGVLPTTAATELLASMRSCPTGFHSQRWVRAYEACCEIVAGMAPGPAFAAPLGIDPEALDASASGPEASRELALLDDLVDGRRVILRVDRIEPSKNIVRGFLAYDLFLERNPQWRERVVFVALLYASRENLAEYQAYRAEVEHAAERVNNRWATAGWTPIALDPEDVYPRSVAGMCRYDVLLVNPLKDGLNLVAKEGPYLNERDGVLALSTEAGAFDELGDAALAVHPFDIAQTASVFESALAMDSDERKARAARLRELTASRTSRHWLDELVAHARAEAG
ncbi:MAG: trehalose-6-phosphate synthase [Actinobacteria bacterium]|nr:trehalose-6-phosphate synthase [Actinomycetota bacterium]